MAYKRFSHTSLQLTGWAIETENAIDNKRPHKQHQQQHTHTRSAHNHKNEEINGKHKSNPKRKLNKMMNNRLNEAWVLHDPEVCSFIFTF